MLQAKIILFFRMVKRLNYPFIIPLLPYRLKTTFKEINKFIHNRISYSQSGSNYFTSHAIADIYHYLGGRIDQRTRVLSSHEAM